MQATFRIGAVVLAGLLTTGSLFAQEAGSGALNQEAIRDSAEDIFSDAQQKADEIAKQVDQSPQAKEVSAGILQPIYLLAEAMAYPQFHWAAFTLMTAGVVSFALQLVLGKLAVLARMSFNIREVLADALGLLISLIGLVLTTQAAAENSTFTESPASVLSAAGLGAILGLVFYWWGQREELQAALGRKTQTKSAG